MRKKIKLNKADTKFGFCVMMDAGDGMPPLMVVSTSIPMVKIAAEGLSRSVPKTSEVKAIGFIVMDNGELATKIEADERGQCVVKPNRHKRKPKTKRTNKAPKS